MIKKILPLLLMFLLTGCYDYKELNTISIVSASTISKQDDKYYITAQVINPQAPDKTTIIQSPFFIYSGYGRTIQEAYREITGQASRFLYTNHLQLLVIDETIAKDDIKQIIDFYLRNPSFRSEFYILISKNNDVINPITPITDISATSIKESIITKAKYQGTSNVVTFNDLINMVLNPNRELAIPSIELIQNTSKDDSIKNTEESNIDSVAKLSNLTIFKDNKLVGYLTERESLTYNIIMNNIKNTILTYECNDNKYISLEIIKSNTKISSKNNKIYLTINMIGNINECECQIDLDNDLELNNVKKLYNNTLKKNIQTDINNIRNTYNSDIFGFLDLIYKTDYKTYNKVKNSWYSETFKKYPINIKTNIKIIAKGNTLEAKDD